jgi:hypothetical protein
MVEVFSLEHCHSFPDQRHPLLEVFVLENLQVFLEIGLYECFHRSWWSLDTFKDWLRIL